MCRSLVRRIETDVGIVCGGVLLVVEPVGGVALNERGLRLGVLLDSDQVPAWMYHALEQVVRSGCAEFSLLVLDDRRPPQKRTLGRLWNARHEVGYRILSALDERLFPSEPDALAPRSALELLPDVPVLEVSPNQWSRSEWPGASVADKIRARGVDILVDATGRVPCGSILDAARYGVWSYYHSDDRAKRGGPPGFWEAVNNWPETGTTLHCRGGRWGDSTVLYRSWFGTYPFSPARNRNRCLWASSSFLARQIALLHRVGEEVFLAEISGYSDGVDVYDGQQYRTPSNLRAAWLAAGLLTRILVEIQQRMSRLVTWYLMFDLTDDISAELCEFGQIKPTKDRFWADPMVVHRDSRYYVFVEEYMYQAQKAHIAVIEMDQQGQYTGPVPVLEESYHLSYPFVVEWQERFWMVPESAENHTIDLYECVEFPSQWRFVMTLMKDVQAVDTTLLYHESRWWLFTAMAENEGSFPEVELFLFYADELVTHEWTPHPQNPIVSDVKRARPAGKIFSRNGRLYRPSQDGSKLYGHGFDLNEILCLSETEYAERTAASVRPRWDRKVLGTHTFAREGQLTVIDALTRRRRLF